MKKIIFAILLTVLLLPQIAFGAESCVWKTKITQTVDNMTTYEGGCAKNETIKAYSFCDADTKPETSYGMRTVQAVCCCQNQAEALVEKAAFTMPEFQVPIDLKLSEAKCTNPDNSGDCSIPWIAEYIQFVYQYGLGIGGILAAVVLMAGGLIWLVSGGDVSKVSQAKSLIIGSITGLMILFGSYILLTQINPNLVSLRSISLKMIEQIIITADSEATTPIALDMNGISQALGINCGSDTVADIIKKSKGKVTYNNPNRGSIGPNNTIYNDCSGFASFVLKCSSNKNAASYTGDIFAEQNNWNENISSLQPGDLVGWSPKNSAQGFGHVFIYMGNGVFGDCHGGTEGRKSGNCVSTNLNLNSVKASASKYSGGKLFIKRY